MSSSNSLATAFDRGNLIKICGLREPEHAAAAAAAGADLLSFIFAPARRQVTAETARACLDAARKASGGREFVSVGVFVDAASPEIMRAVQIAGLDAVQLSGSESAVFVRALSVPVIKALLPRGTVCAEDIVAEMDTYRFPERTPAGFLFDKFAEGSFGGTGERADWNLASAVNERHPIMLAGGLDSENVRDAIQTVRPLGVDVSSGVETNGVKDPMKIEAFILAARQAFHSLEKALP